MSKPLLKRGFLPAIVVAFVALAAFAASASALNAPQVSTDYNQTCVLHDTGTVQCVGNGTEGALGHGTTDSSLNYVDATDITGGKLTNITQIAVGDNHGCALKIDGSVWCWGSNEYFQLGQGGVATGRSTRAVPVTYLAGATQISAQDNTTCATIADGGVKCWGANEELQAGDGLPGHRSTPTTVVGVTGAVKVASGGRLGCALVSGGAVKCWGADDYGQRGDGGGFGAAGTATAVVGITGATDIGAGSNHACALVGTTVKCWGYDSDGQLGNGLPETNSDAPVETGLTGVSQLAVGYSTTCALVSGGGIKCWGNNGDGQLGNGSVFDEPSPVDVTGLKGAVLISQDFDYSVCAGFAGGRVACWGENEDGQLGVGSKTPEYYTTPVEVPGLDIVTQQHPAIAPKVSVAGKPKVDRKKRTYTIAGVFAAGLPSFVAGSEACVGSAAITTSYRFKTVKAVKKGGKKLRKTVRRSRTVKLSPMISSVQGGCALSFALKLPVKYLNGKTVAIEAAFVGNDAVQGYGSTAKVRLPKVKIKKRR